MPDFYKHKFESPRKPGTWIFVQTDEERKAATQIVSLLRKRWSPPRYFYHLRNGGHVSALHAHKNDAYFATLDIESFFGSITRNKICTALKKIGLSFADAQVIAHRSCVAMNGKRFLPFGYVQSPLLASIVLDTSNLGIALRKVRAGSVRVSVFMDDIVLSHADDVGQLEEAVMLLNKAASETHFVLSDDKSQSAGEEVQAFNIIMAHGDLRLTKSRFEDFARRVLELQAGNATFGILGYVAQVNLDQKSQLEALIH